MVITNVKLATGRTIFGYDNSSNHIRGSCGSWQSLQESIPRNEEDKNNRGLDVASVFDFAEVPCHNVFVLDTLGIGN